MSPRKPPAIQPPALVIHDSGLQTETRRYRISTLLFGGGVRTGENDVQQLIRATSVRGQLRFWWRACCGGSATDPSVEGLRARETALWGGVSGSSPAPSLVQVQVDGIGSSQTPIEGRAIGHPSSPYAYAGFPLRDQNHSVRQGVEFTLTLRYPQELAGRAVAQEIEATLWAWETFGGIGARTRRGFGAIERLDPAPAPTLTLAAIQARLKMLIPANWRWPAQVPHLHQRMRLKIIDRNLRGQPFADATAAWLDLLHELKSFRQTRNQQRNNPRPGRSRWPEPDAIRDIVKQRSPKHAGRITNDNVFPRAAFGLPIIFKFIDDDQGHPTNPHADPAQTSLQLEKYDRFASPLILKPLSGNKQVVGLLAVLEGTSLAGQQLILKQGNATVTKVRGTLTRAEAAAIHTQGPPPTPLFPAGVVDSIDAFLAQF